MSLAVLAQDMASKGRNGDSMLVHMTPGEVAGLHALAIKHGGELTINPETGLPEANFLKSLLPIALGAFLGPAGAAFSSIGGGFFGSALAAGAAVGGITGLATGSLSKGLMAGLGAYGGFGLGEALTSAGVGALEAGAASAAQGQLGAANLALGEALPAEAAAQFTQDAAARQMAAATPFDKLSSGFSAATSSPSAMGQFAKDNLKYLGAAAAPVLADQMVQTTTKAPVTDTGNIRKFSFDPYSQRYTPQGVFPAAGYKGGMANGGIVALAGGGNLTMPEGWGTAGGAYDTPEEKIAYFNKQNITPDQLLGSNQGVTQADIDYMSQQGYAGTGIAPGSNKYVENVGNFFSANPNATYQDIQTAAQGLNQQDVTNAMKQSGLSGAAQYAAFNQNIGSEANTAETYGGLKGISNNINYWLEQHPGASAQDIRREMAKYDLSDQDFIRATGTDVNRYAMGPITQVQNVAEGAGGNTTAVVNENGTISQVALPTSVTGGQPTGTIQNIKDIYTQGGGSLGYTPKAPIDMAEFNTRFNTLTPGGDSEAAYKYLMGQGAYPTKSNVGEIMKPYSEAVLGVPQDLSTKKYLYDNKTRKMVLNPDYVPMSFDTKGVQSFGMSQADIGKYLKANNTAPDTDVYAWAAANKVSPEQIAAALGADPALIRAKWAAAIKGTTGTVSTDNKTVTVGSTDYSLSNPSIKPPADSQGDWKWVDSGTDGGEKWERAGTGGTTGVTTDLTNPAKPPTTDPGSNNEWLWDYAGKKWYVSSIQTAAAGGLQHSYAAGGYAMGGLGNLGGYSDGGRLLKGPGDGVSDSIPATIGQKQQPARLADGEFVIPARIVSELGNGSTDAGAKKLYAMMDRVQRARGKTTGKNKVAANSRAEKYLPA